LKNIYYCLGWKGLSGERKPKSVQVKDLCSSSNPCECSFATLSCRKPTSEKYLLDGKYWDQSHKKIG